MKSFYVTDYPGHLTASSFVHQKNPRKVRATCGECVLESRFRGRFVLWNTIEIQKRCCQRDFRFAVVWLDCDCFREMFGLDSFDIFTRDNTHRAQFKLFVNLGWVILRILIQNVAWQVPAHPLWLWVTRRPIHLMVHISESLRISRPKDIPLYQEFDRWSNNEKKPFLLNGLSTC